MTDESVAPELSLIPDAKVFDLKAALAGRTYPERTVSVFLDEALAWSLKQANEAALRDPNSEEKEAERARLVDKFKALTLTFHLRGVPRYVRVALEAENDELYPPKYSLIGAPLPDPEKSSALTEAMWGAYITHVTNANGEAATMSPEDVVSFRRDAPEASVDAVTKAIQSLLDDSETGYELGVQELSFLSQPSPEA